MNTSHPPSNDCPSAGGCSQPLMEILPAILADLQAESQRLQPELETLRQRLHQHPEASGFEFQTTVRLREFLEEHQLPSVLAEEERGLLADIGECHPNNTCVAIRGDIDALEIETELKTEHASQVPGVMHACGHDVHASIAAGAGVLLQRLCQRDRLPADFAARVILQPAEETSRGAKHMIRSGALRNIDAAVALHADPNFEVGTIGLRYGMLTANCDVFTVDVHGTGGHGARPHLATDPLSAGLAWVNQVYRQVPRQSDPFDPMAITVGQFQAGAAANVIPATARLAGTIRTVSDVSLQTVKQELQRISRGIEMMMDVRVELHFLEATPGVLNDKDLCDHIASAAGMLDSVARTVAITRPSLGGEDFAFYGEHVPIAMFRLGSRQRGAVDGEPTAHALHTPQFDVDPRCLGIGAELLALTAILHAHA